MSFKQIKTWTIPIAPKKTYTVSIGSGGAGGSTGSTTSASWPGSVFYYSYGMGGGGGGASSSSTGTINEQETVPEQKDLPKQKKVKRGNAEGYECLECQEFYPMAELNMPEGDKDCCSFKCYSCRHGLSILFKEKRK